MFLKIINDLTAQDLSAIKLTLVGHFHPKFYLLSSEKKTYIQYSFVLRT